MIDPFTALGLASAVLQFIDFGSTVYGEYKRLRNGSLNGNNARAVSKSFEAALNDLTNVNRVLKSTPRLHNASETESILIQHEEVSAPSSYEQTPSSLLTPEQGHQLSPRPSHGHG